MAHRYAKDTEDYKQCFPKRWAQGERNAQRVLRLMEQLGKPYDRAAFLTGIVFPDLMKLSLFRSGAENLAAFTLTAFTGHHNLSIGFFQMKPSCACEIECYLDRHPELHDQYAKILYCGKRDRLNTILRNHRLSKPETAVYYADSFLTMFYDIYRKDHDCGPIDLVFREEGFPTRQRFGRKWASPFP